MYNILKYMLKLEDILFETLVKIIYFYYHGYKLNITLNQLII